MVERRRVRRHRQRLHRHAEGGQRRPQIGLGVHRIDRPRAATPSAAAWCRRAGRRRPDAGRRGASTRERRPDLEQRRRRHSRARRCASPPAPASRSASAASWSRSAAIGLVRRSASGVAPNSAASAVRHEAEGDALGQALRRQRAPRQRGALLLRRQRRRRHRRGARQRHRRHRVEAAQAQHFLDQVAFRLDLGAAFGRLRRDGADRASGDWSSATGAATSLRQDGTATVTLRRIAMLHVEAEALQRRDRFVRARYRSRRTRRCARTASWRRAARPAARRPR